MAPHHRHSAISPRRLLRLHVRDRSEPMVLGASIGDIPEQRTPFRGIITQEGILMRSYSAEPSFLHNRRVREVHDRCGSRFRVKLEEVGLEDSSNRRNRVDILCAHTLRIPPRRILRACHRTRTLSHRGYRCSFHEALPWGSARRASFLRCASNARSWPAWSRGVPFGASTRSNRSVSATTTALTTAASPRPRRALPAGFAFAASFL